MSALKISSVEVSVAEWLPAANCDYAAPGGTDLWQIGVSANLYMLDTFSALLSREEISQANRYFQLRDKNSFIVRRGGLRMILGRYLNMEPLLLQFGQGADKKPFVKYSDLFYNVSHSGDLVLLAVSNAETGCDIELINRKFGFGELLKDYFSSEEKTFVEQEDSIDRFFTLWTRKEAFTKAIGKGLDGNLKLIPSLEGDHLLPADKDEIWISRSFKIETGYMATICSKHSSIGLYKF